jgi:hypothetical protein
MEQKCRDCGSPAKVTIKGQYKIVDCLNPKTIIVKGNWGEEEEKYCGLRQMIPIEKKSKKVLTPRPDHV